MNYFSFDADGDLNCFYRGSDKSIYRRVRKNGKWSRAVCVVSDVRKNYTLTDPNGTEIICQDAGGDMILCRLGANGWENRVLLESRRTDISDIKMLRFEDSLVFNAAHDGQHTLFVQRKNENKWSKAEPADSFVPFREDIFGFVRLKDGRGLLIYRKNLHEQRLYFRIIEKNGDIGEARAVYSANGIIEDVSVTDHDGLLHFVIAVRNRFSCRAVYVRAAEQAAERKNTVVWEGGSIKNTAIRAEDDKITIVVSAGERFYTFVSINDAFKGMDVKNTGERMAKAHIKGGEKFGCNDIIVPSDRPYSADVSFLNSR